MTMMDMLTEMSTRVSANYIEELKKKDPKALEEITRLFINMTDLAVQILREDEQFKKHFAKIHSEFLKYPESKVVIQDSVEAYKKLNGDLK